MAQSVKLMIALAIFLTFTLQFYVPMSIIWRGIKNKIAPEKQNMSEYALRVGLVVSENIVFSNCSVFVFSYFEKSTKFYNHFQLRVVYFLITFD